MKVAITLLATSNLILIIFVLNSFTDSTPEIGNPAEINPGNRYYYNCEVIRIIDGDTVEARIDLGFDTQRIETLRLFGIDTPEIRGKEKEKGKIAKDWLENELKNADEVTIQTIKDKTGSFGRYLAVLFCDGRNLNEQMITEKIAVQFK